MSDLSAPMDERILIVHNLFSVGPGPGQRAFRLWHDANHGAPKTGTGHDHV